MKDLFYTIVAGIILLSGNVKTFAQTWVATSAPNIGWHGIACSADGSKVVAVPNSGAIYISTNSGLTWVTGNSPVSSWSAVVSSADGNKLAAVPQNGLILTSTNGGMTWDTNALASPINSYWYVLSGSADGNMLLVSTGDPPTYVSTNWGLSWTNTGPNDFLEWVAASADGTKLVGACSVGYVYTSVDSGISWMQTTLPVGEWNSVASSSDGSKLVVVAETSDFYTNRSIYTSTNSGTNWTEGIMGIDDNAWLSVASSANGVNLVIANALRDEIGISTNSGQSWLPTFSPGAYRVASSADGSRLFMTQFEGGIYMLQPGGPLQVKLSGGNVVLSLPVYATNDYALQQNFDLSTTNWSSVTNTPTETNGLLQFVLTPPGSNCFFRLNRYY